MGLFEKKYCSVCGEKIRLLGNRKLEDGNLCKNCAKKLSEWFDERRHSTVEQIKSQLSYRDENLAKAKAFNTTRTFGQGYKKLYVDDNAKRFTVSGSRDFASDNPDILDFSQLRGCDLEIREDRDEIYRETENGRVSYSPPRYEYSYDFKVTLKVDHPYFDDMYFDLNSGSVDTGETRMNPGAQGAWHVSSFTSGFLKSGVEKYNELVETGNEIKEMTDSWMRGASQNTPYASSPGAVPYASKSGSQTFEVSFKTVTPIPYAENVNGNMMSLFLDANGAAEISVTSPDTLSILGDTESMKGILGNELMMAVNDTVVKCSIAKLPADSVISGSAGLENTVKSSLNSQWPSKYGLTLQSFSQFVISMTPESRGMYDQMQKMQAASAQFRQNADTQSSAWTCPYCNTQNSGNFCSGCGAKREG